MKKIIFTDEEIKVLKKIAIYHKHDTITKLQINNIDSLILRFMDFRCYDYLDEHITHGLTKELSQKVIKYFKSKQFRSKKITCEIPSFLVINLILEKLNKKDAIK